MYARAGFNRIWNQVTGYGIPREIEGFQAATPAEQARAMLATFFGLWNNWPSGLARDSGGAINTMFSSKWSGYVSPTTSDFTAANFGYIRGLSKSFVAIISYSNSSTTVNSVTLSNVKINDVIYSPSSINFPINSASLIFSCDQYTSTQCEGTCRINILSSDYANCVAQLNNSRVGTARNIITPAIGTVSYTFSFTSDTLVQSISFDQTAASVLTTINLESFTISNNIRTYLFKTHSLLIFDFNNIYTALLIDLYTSINTRHSTAPPIPYTLPPYIQKTTTWSALDTGFNGKCSIIAIGQDGIIYTGGEFTSASSKTVNRIAKWNGSVWSELSSGLNNYCNAITIQNGMLYAGGAFTSAGGVSTNRIAKWDGTTWSTLGDGLGAECRGIAVDSNGVVFACGHFTTTGENSANYIARWNGTSWSALGSGFDNVCITLTIGPDGFLYAGGQFTTAGGNSANYIARWNGTTWSALGSGLNGACYKIAFGPDNSLYACGVFTQAGGASANRIAKWNGTAWSALGSGLNASCWSVEVGTDGFLYAGGQFTQAGGNAANYIARWNGTIWSAIESGLGAECVTIARGQDGSIYTGGNFTTANDLAATNIALYKKLDRNDALAGTNTDAIKNNYLNTYLPAQYNAVYKQVGAMITNLQGATSNTLADDTQRFNNLPSTPNSTFLIDNLITLTNIYNRHSSSYASLVKPAIYLNYVLKFNSLYKRALTYLETSKFTEATNTFFATINSYISATTNASTTIYNNLTDAQILSLQNNCDAATRDILTKLITEITQLNQNNPSDFTVPTSVTASIATPPTIPSAYSGLETFWNNSVFKPFEDWVVTMRQYVKDYIDGYARNAGAAGITPELNAATYKGYVDSTAAPWNAKEGNSLPAYLYRLPLTDIDSNTPFISNNSIKEFNGNYVISGSVNTDSAWKSFSSGIQNQKWTFTRTQGNDGVFLILQLPTRMSLQQITLSQEYSNAPYYRHILLWGSNDGINYNFIESQSVSTNVNFILTQKSSAYSFFRINLAALTASTTDTLPFSVSALTIGMYSGIIVNTKLDQLRTIYNIFRDAGASFDAISKIRDFYNNSYIPGARYLKSADMALTVPYAGSTLTLQQVATKCLNYLNTDGTAKTTALQTGDASFTDLLALMNAANTKFVEALIDRFYAVHTDWSRNRGLTALTGIPTDDGAVDKTALSTAFSATRTTYLGTTRWGALLSAVQARSKAMVNSAKALQGWKTAGVSASYTYPFATPVNTKGLGLSLA